MSIFVFIVALVATIHATSGYILIEEPDYIDCSQYNETDWEDDARYNDTWYNCSDQDVIKEYNKNLQEKHKLMLWVVCVLFSCFVSGIAALVICVWENAPCERNSWTYIVCCCCGIIHSDRCEHVLEAYREQQCKSEGLCPKDDYVQQSPNDKLPIIKRLVLDEGPVLKKTTDASDILERMFV